MMERKSKEEILAGMDEAAKQAKEDFEKLPEEIKKHASKWVYKWYLKAGYKRLGRLLVAYAKERAKAEESA